MALSLPEDCYDYDRMFPLSPVSDSLWSTSTSTSEDSFISTIDDHYNDNSNHDKQEAFDIDFNSYDHLETITRPLKKQAVVVAVKATATATSEMETQTEEVSEERETVIIAGDMFDKLEKLSIYYGSYGADCICFSGLYRAGVLLSKKIQSSDYQEYIKGKAKASEFLCRIFQRNFRNRSDVAFFELHIQKLRESCNNVAYSRSRQSCLMLINSFISLHLDNGTPSG